MSCTSGLCNRIHSFIGGKVLAEKLGREMLIFWPENSELNAPARFVFANPPDLISSDDLLFHLSRPEITVKVFNSGFGQSLECDRVEESDHDVLFVKPWFVPRLKGELHTSHTYFPLRKYLPCVEFRPEIVSMATPGQYANHVGVHIRYGDPLPGGLFAQKDYFSQSSLERFKRVMDLICRKRPDTQFYVSSTSQEIKYDLAKNFDVDYRDTTPYRTTEGIQDAIIDLVNLCGCSCLVGSYRSQFTRMVGFMTQKTVAIISDSPHLDFVVCIPETLESIADWSIRRLSGNETPDPLQSPPNSLHLPPNS